MNRRQTASKLWLLDSLNETHGGDLGSVHILGGWCGVLASLFHDSRFKVNHITSFDIDPSCAPIADSLNADAVERAFSTETADILQLRYTVDSVQINNRKVSARPDLLINTSCEHLEDFDAWFRAMPQDTLLVLQSNDYFSEAEHVVQPDLAAFRGKRQCASSSSPASWNSINIRGLC